MKPPKDTRPIHDLRVTRKSNVDLHHGDGHGWAVSYADLLMVLLSFFVMYFSFAEEDPNSAHDKLKQIALAMKGEGATAAQRKPDSVDFSNLEDVLKIEGVKVTQKDDHLLVELEQGVFGSGDYRINSGLQKQVDVVVEKLTPFKESLAIMVIGHADKRPLVPRNEFLRDNFDLSSLRALNVLKRVIAKGVPENRASARAASSYDRDARSITFEIRLAKRNLAGDAS